MIQLLTQQLMMQQMLMQQQMLKGQGITLGESPQKETLSPPEKSYITDHTDLTAAPPEEQPYKTGPLKKNEEDHSFEGRTTGKIKTMYNNIVPVVNELIKIGSIDSAKNIMYALIAQIEDEGINTSESQEVKKVVNNLRTASESLTNIIIDMDHAN